MQDSIAGQVASWMSTAVTWRGSSALSSDVELLRRLAGQALQDLTVEFSDLGGLNLLFDLTLDVQVHEGSGGEASMHSDVPNGRPHAVLEMLAPSRHAAQARTIVDEPKDQVYVHKTLVHELSMLFLWQVTRRKAVGWGLFCGPDWFVDGWEEYLALTRSSTHTRTITLPRYHQRVKAKWAPGQMPTVDRYLDGPIIIEFMHQRFGRDKLFALLRSKECTFAEGLSAVCHRDETGLLADWRTWLTT